MIVPLLFGGMCNQMAQTMCAIAYARKHNMPYAIPTHTSNPRWRHYKFGKVHYEDVPVDGFYHYKSPDIFYDNRPYDVSYHEIPYHENIILEGHFQSWKYWLEYIDEIRELFQWQIQPFKASDFENSIAVHVRRGDYLSMPDKLPPVNEEYVYKGIDYFIQRGFKSFYFFSDDRPYIFDMLKEFNLATISIGFPENNSDRIDLAMMSSCAGIVMANSSFSLLSYYLNRNVNKQLPVCPARWFGEGYGYVNVTDLYPQGAVIL